MKASKISKGLLLGRALLLATSAFAANKGSLRVDEAVNVNGKQLTPGDYKVSWEGNGPSVELHILQGKNVVATVPAKMVDLPRAASDDGAVVSTNGDGSRTLSQIRFSGKKYALAIGGDTANADMSK
jgi:hypothetical protein